MYVCLQFMPQLNKVNPLFSLDYLFTSLSVGTNYTVCSYYSKS